MNNIQDLIDCIQSSWDSAKGNWYYKEWQTTLNSKVPNWKSLVREPMNLITLEKYFSQLNGLSWLFEVLADTNDAQNYIAERWLTSPDSRLQHASSWWYGRNFSQLWDDLKENNPVALVNLLVHDLIRESTPLEPRYAQIIQDNYLYSKTQLPYKPQQGLSCNEAELVDVALNYFYQNKYEIKQLPEIFISFEKPPLFRQYPDLAKDVSILPDDERCENSDKDIKFPASFSIEEYLGCYKPSKKHIIVYFWGIRWACIRRIKHHSYHGYLSPEWLIAVVLIHELGHWVSHQLVKPGGQPWDLDLYNSASRDVHEGLAQWLTWHVGEQVGGDFKVNFENLNKNQSPPYHVFKNFTGIAVKDMLNSLEFLRSLESATLADWKKYLNIP